ncbi:MAG: histidine kinase N-terminal domain-containing protein [Anaerolineae bacterium]|nr:histidine kinase N-terminal domain-containing protein [Anaerolineae bacterium]
MYKLVCDYLELTEDETTFLQTIEQQLGILADLSRADVLLYGRQSPLEAVVLTHAQPHSIAHVYSKNQQGRVVNLREKPEIKRALLHGQRQKDKGGYISEGAPVFKRALPIYFPPLGCDKSEEQKKPGRSRVIAALVIVTNLLEYERHRRRNKVFRKAIKKLQEMVWCGQLWGTEDLSPFGEQDGIIFIDCDGIIRYASGVAANLYRKLGYKDALIGRHLSHLETADEEVRQLALAENRCIERESEEAEGFWIRKVLPLKTYSLTRWGWPNPFKPGTSKQRYGVLITLHDDTESRRQDREIQIKNAMIQEVHHRVKNNLQTIAGLLRMQTRRTESEEARQVLTETQNRILSIAVIHEFLSNESADIINIKEVGHKIVAQLRQGVLSPDQQIEFKITGDSISIPPRQATACSLIMNELLQNAIEHGFPDEKSGFIHINLEDGGDEAIISVTDNGRGLPDDFTLEQTKSLGLQIVKTLVESDLKGQLELRNGIIDSGGISDAGGLSVKIIFPKQ